MNLPPRQIVSVEWLARNLEHKNLVVLYSRMDNPVTKERVLPSAYIPGARLFDFENEFCDTESKLPHTMPSDAKFQHQARRLGINSDSVIVVYDDKGIYCAPRVWWMFKSMGHKQVFVLDGGLPQWQANNLPLQSALVKSSQQGNFKACYSQTNFMQAEQIVASQNKINMIDARSAGRFYGNSPEPRKGLRSGHMPNALNLPFEECLQGSRLRPVEQLKTVFSQLPIKSDQPLVCSCGSGVTACILALAAMETGYSDISVYDGSWSEWGARLDLPVTCQ